MLTSRVKMSSTRPRRGERRADSSSPSSERRMIVRTSGTGATRRTRCCRVSSSSLRRSGEAAGLDLDQQVAADEIDDETADDLFDAIAGALVPDLELSVQRTLVERPNRRDLTFFVCGDLEHVAHDDAPSPPPRSCLRPAHRPGQAGATTHGEERPPRRVRKFGRPSRPARFAGRSELGTLRARWRATRTTAATRSGLKRACPRAVPIVFAVLMSEAGYPDYAPS